MALNQLGLGMTFSARDLASGVMQKVRGGFAQTRGDAEKLSEATKNSFASLKTGAALFTAGATALTSMFALTVPAAAEFGQKVAEISTLTDEASLNTAFLSDAVLELNAVYGGGTGAQAKALYNGISAGAANASQASALLNASNRLAVAGVTEVGVALDGLTSSLNAYGVSFDDAASFSDSMFVAVQKGKTTIAELGATIGRVAPTGAALGVSFDDLTASIAAITTKGLKTEEAITGLKAALANVMAPTADAEKEAKRLGVEFSAAAIRAKGFPKFLQEITSSAEFNQDSLQKLFSSTEALNAMLALTANGGSAFAATLEAMRQKGGATDRAFEKMSATLAFQGKRFEGLLENARIMVGQALEPIAAAVVGVASSFVEAFTNLPKPFQEFVVRAVAAGAAVVSFVGAVIAAKAAIAIIAAALTTLSAPALGVVVAVGAVVALLAGLKMAVDRNLGGLGDRWRSFTESVSLAWEALGQLFSDGGFSGKVREEFQKGANPAINFAVRLYVIAGRIKSFFSGVVDGISSAIDAAAPSFEAFGNAVSRIGDAFSDMWETVDPASAGEAFDAYASGGKKVGSALGRVITAVTNIATAALELIGGIAKGAEGIGDAVDPILDAFSDLGKEIAKIGVELGLMNNEAEGAASGWVALGQLVGGALRLVVNGYQGIFGGLVGYFKSVFSVLSGIVMIFNGDVSRGLQRVMYGVVNGVAQMVLGLVEAFSKIGDTILAPVLRAMGLPVVTFGDKIAEFRKGLDETLYKGFGLNLPTDAGGQTPTTPPATMTPVPIGTPEASPIMASGVEQNMSIDPGSIDALGKAVAAGASKQQPQVIHVMLDGQVLASAQTNASNADAARSFAPQMSTME